MAGCTFSLFMRSRIRQFSAIFAAIVILLILTILRIYKCPLDFFLGIPCPLCGITRAFLSIAKGDIAGSFYYHPLWPVILAAFVLFVLSTLGIISPSKKTKDTAAYALSFLLLVCYIIRHIQGSPVVKVHFETSLVNRILVLLSGLTVKKNATTDPSSAVTPLFIRSSVYYLIVLYRGPYA